MPPKPTKTPGKDPAPKLIKRMTDPTAAAVEVTKLTAESSANDRDNEASIREALLTEPTREQVDAFYRTSQFEWADDENLKNLKNAEQNASLIRTDVIEKLLEIQPPVDGTKDIPYQVVEAVWKAMEKKYRPPKITKNIDLPNTDLANRKAQALDEEEEEELDERWAKKRERTRKNLDRKMENLGLKVPENKGKGRAGSSAKAVEEGSSWEDESADSTDMIMEAQGGTMGTQPSDSQQRAQGDEITRLVNLEAEREAARRKDIAKGKKRAQ